MTMPDPATVADLRRRIEQRFGLEPRKGEDTRLLEGIRDLAKRRGLSPRSLAMAAMGDSALQLEIAGIITVEESYFFRHPSHVEAMRRILRERSGMGGSVGPCKVWSAGCSGGEEPYTVAMIAKEVSHGPPKDRIDVLGTDLSVGAVAKAKSGVYGQWSLRETGEAALSAYFEPHRGRSYMVKDEIRETVRFRHGDLFETARHMASGSFDLILFRNVSIYLTESYLDRFWEELFRILSPKGFLLMSATDALPPKELFHPADEGGIASLLKPNVAPKRDTAPARPRILSKSLPRRRRKVKGREAPCPSPVSRGADLARITALADRGESERALSILDMRLGLFPEDFDGLVLRGQICLALAEPHDARDDLEKAVALNPENKEARYWLALSYLETGQRAGARDQVERILSRNESRNGTGTSGEEIEHEDLVRAAMDLKENLS